MKKSTSLTLKDLQKKIVQFRDKRGWKKYHHPKSLALSILIEAAELAEHFQWETTDELEKEIELEKKREIAAELADVLNYCLLLADRLDIDFTEAFLNKLAASAEKFPEGQVWDLEAVKKRRKEYKRRG